MKGTSRPPALASSHLRDARARWSGALFCSVLILAAVPAAAQSCLRPAGALDLSPLNHEPHDVVIRDGLAYVADGYGLTIYDVSLPSAPQALGAVLLPASGSGVAVSGDKAYVAIGPPGIEVVDIADPRKPRRVCSVEVGGDATHLAIQDGILVVSAGQSGLVTLDLRDPGRPALLGRCPAKHLTSALSLANGFAYVIDGGDLLVVSLSDPRYPVTVGSLESPAVLEDIAVSGHVAFLVEYFAGLIPVDVSDPENPVIFEASNTARVAVPQGGFGSIALDDDRAYVTYWPDEVFVGDLSDPRNPRWMWRIELAGGPVGIDAWNRHALVALRDRGLAVIDASSDLRSEQVGLAECAGASLDLDLTDSLLVLADGGPGLVLAAQATPGTRTMVGRLELPDRALTVTAFQDIAVVGTLNGLATVDLGDPAAPVLLAWMSRPGLYPIAVAASGAVIFVQAGYGVDAYDVSNPLRPEGVGHLLIAGYGNDVAVSGDRLLTAAREGVVTVVDTSDPEHMEVLESIQLDGCTRTIVAMGESVAAAGCAEGEVVLLGLEDPYHPRELARVEVGTPVRALTVSGTTVYVAGEHGGLVAVDASGPMAPRIAGRIRLRRPATALAVNAEAETLVAATGPLVETVRLNCLQAEIDHAERGGVPLRPPQGPWSRSVVTTSGH